MFVYHSAEFSYYRAYRSGDKATCIIHVTFTWDEGQCLVVSHKFLSYNLNVGMSSLLQVKCLLIYQDGLPSLFVYRAYGGKYKAINVIQVT